MKFKSLCNLNPITFQMLTLRTSLYTTSCNQLCHLHVPMQTRFIFIWPTLKMPSSLTSIHPNIIFQGPFFIIPDHDIFLMMNSWHLFT